MLGPQEREQREKERMQRKLDETNVRLEWETRRNHFFRLSIELLAIPESILSGRKYLTGNAFTMGDIPFGCELQRYMRVPIERPKLPNVEAYFERLRERAAYRQHVDIPLS